MGYIFKAFGWCLNLLVTIVALVLLYTVAWPVYLIVHYVVAPVLYYALLVYGYIVTGLWFCVSFPVRMVFRYIVLPPSRLIASPFVRMKAASTKRSCMAFRRQFGIEGVAGFSHHDLVFGADRYNLGRAQMTLQTAECDLARADELASQGYWFGCLNHLWRANDHLANARNEMNLVAARRYLAGERAEQQQETTFVPVLIPA